MGVSKQSAGPAKMRLVSLDVLRFLAIVLVLGRHMWPLPNSLADGWKSALSTWHRGGWVGVDLFFVLSGFLVSGLLFAEYKSRGSLSIVRFYTRRGWKIYPPFFALMATTVIVDRMAGVPLQVRAVGTELLFLQSYVPAIWNHTWSLAVEEHFYLLLPLVIVLMLKLNRGSLKPMLALATCVAIGVLCLRLQNWLARPDYVHETHLSPSHLRLDSLFFGVAIAYVYHFHTDRFVERLTPWRWPLIVGGVLLLTPAFIFELETTPFIFTVGLTIFYIASGMLLVGALLCRWPQNRFLGCLAAIGAYSYSIYLWHMPVIEWGLPLLMRTWGPAGFVVQATFYLAGSLLMGIVMARLIEVPVLRFRDRWFPSRAKGTAEPLAPLPIPLPELQTSLAVEQEH